MELPNVEETLFPPPLEEGIPLELYERCVCAQPDAGTKEPQEKEVRTWGSILTPPHHMLH